MTELFRRQAVDYQRQKFHGAIILTRSPRQTIITAFFVALVLALVVFASTQGFARRETVSGVLLPAGGVLRLVAPRAGVVLAIGAAQGSQVAGGDTLFRLSEEQSSAAGSTQAAVAATLAQRQGSLRDELRAQGEQTRHQAAALDARIASMESGVAQQEREIALQRQRVALVRDVAGRYPDLVRSGAVSPVEATEKQTELLDQEARQAELERALVATRSELASLRADRAALPLAAGRESQQIHREMQALAQAEAENDAKREARVLAPQGGEVATVLAAPGQSVVAGQTLATLLPAGSALEAELYVPTRAAGFVRPGTVVWLRVDAFPYERFGQLRGNVREVARSTAAPSELAAGLGDHLAADAPGVYRVRVALDADSAADALPWRAALKSGMRVQASLVAERRTLVQWAIEPLAAFKVAGR